MLDPHELYELTADLPDLGRPVLIQALTGFVDAGAATRLALVDSGALVHRSNPGDPTGAGFR